MLSRVISVCVPAAEVGARLVEEAVDEEDVRVAEEAVGVVEDVGVGEVVEVVVVVELDIRLGMPHK